MKNMNSTNKTTLYVWNKQKESPYPTGFEMEQHLKDEGLLDQCLSLEDEIVKGWIAKPKTYPEEYKGVYPYLWKSMRTSGSDRVAYLFWDGGRVVVRWYWLGDRWLGDNPALLASSGLSSLDSMTLESAIKLVKKKGYKIFKEI